jgi:hypothetical protein
MGGACARMWRRGMYIEIMVGKAEGKRPLGIPRRKSLDNIKIYLREIYGVVWTGSICLNIETSGGLL